MSNRAQKIRWRLILGDEADDWCGGLDGLDGMGASPYTYEFTKALEDALQTFR